MAMQEISFPTLKPLFIGVSERIKQATNSAINPGVTLSPGQLKLLHHPFAKYIGMSDVTIVQPGTVTATLDLKNYHANAYGQMVDGGVLATIADNSMAAAAQSIAPSGKIAVTTQLVEEFRNPAILKPEGQLFVTATTLDDLDGPVVGVGAEIKDEKGNVLSRTAAKFNYADQRNFSSTVTSNHETYTATAPSNESLSLKNKNLQDTMNAKIAGKSITIAYDSGDLVDGLEITFNDNSEKPQEPLFIELLTKTDKEEDLKTELQSICEMIELANPLEINLEPLTGSSKSPREEFIFKKMQEYFQTTPENLS